VSNQRRFAVNPNITEKHPREAQEKEKPAKGQGVHQHSLTWSFMNLGAMKLIHLSIRGSNHPEGRKLRLSYISKKTRKLAFASSASDGKFGRELIGF
jgi:hypothetical protein